MYIRDFCCIFIFKIFYVQLHMDVNTYTYIYINENSAAVAKSHQLCPTLCNPIDGSPPGSLSLGFSRLEHWSGLPFPSPMHENEK